MSQEILDQVRRRRTFAIISHPDAGKTTLTEKLLLFSGAIQSAGTVKGKKTGKFATSDWMEIEKQRGISVASSVMQFDYKDHTVNLLDTPGHQDFSEDTYRVLTAVDSALMVIDAAKGVEAQTIKLLNVCRLRNTPIVTFMNKYDREVRDSLELLDEVENILKIRCAPVTWPIGMGKNFKGVYHILNDEIYLFEAGGERLPHEFDIIKGINNPELEQRFPLEIQQLRDEIELVQAASNEFNLDEFLAGELRAQNLRRNEPTSNRIARLPDLAHTTLSDRGEQHVPAAEQLADARCGMSAHRSPASKRERAIGPATSPP